MLYIHVKPYYLVKTLDLLTIGINTLNVLTPFALALLLYKGYQEKKRRFYLCWILSFLFYGLSNLINVYNRLISTENPNTIVLLGLSSFIAFTALMLGIGELTNKTRLYLIISLSIPVFTGILFLAGAPVYLFTVSFLVPYIITTGVLIIISLKYQVNLNALILGWMVILLSNIGLVANFLTITTAPLVSLIGKLFVYYWMTQPYFSKFAEEIETLLGDKQGGSSTIGERYINMIETRSDIDTIRWILEQVEALESRGFSSLLFLTTNKDEALDTSRVESNKNVYLFKITEGYHKKGAIFSDRIMEISNNVSEISVLIYDLLEYIRIHNLSVQLFFFDIGFFIKRNGWRRVYSQMISLIPQFKSADLHVNFIYNRDNLENHYIIEIMRHLADNIVKIED